MVFHQQAFRSGVKQLECAPVALEPSLEQFLGAGPGPLVFTLGSLIVNSPGSFYLESLNAARQLGMRAVLLAGEKAIGQYSGLASDRAARGAAIVLDRLTSRYLE